MEFTCFPPHAGSCDCVMPPEFYIQQNDLAFGDMVHEYAPVCASMLSFPTADFYHECCSQEEIMFTATGHSSPIVHKPKSHLHMLTPKTEVSHLIAGGLESYKAHGMTASSQVFRNANVVKGQWTLEEDSKLVKLVEQFGLRKWSQIAQMLPGRVGKQCRERWHNHLRPNMKKDSWSEEEDIVLIQTHKEVGNKWAEIAKRLPGRTENSIKNHRNATKRRQFARRRSRGSAKNPQSGTLLQNYIKSLGIGSSKVIAPFIQKEPPVSPSSPASPTPNPAKVNAQMLGSNPSNITDTQGIFSINNAHTQSCEKIKVPTCDDFSIDMCDGLFDTKEEALYQVYSIDDDADINYIFNHIDYPIRIDDAIDMKMAWDDDILENNESGSLPSVTPIGSTEIKTLHLKKEMDLVEMVVHTEACS